LMGKTLILKSLLRSLNSISFMLIIFTFKLIQKIRILWFCHRSHGHLGIIMTQVEYAAISASPWVEPYNPNAIPIIPPGTNAVDAAQIARMHDKFFRIYTTIINVDQALKWIILEAYDNMYTSQLEDYLLQYAD
jgi:hypothetical protein